MTTRAGVKATSIAVWHVDPNPITLQCLCSLTFTPSSLRSRFSSNIFKEKGNRFALVAKPLERMNVKLLIINSELLLKCRNCCSLFSPYDNWINIFKLTSIVF